MAGKALQQCVRGQIPCHVSEVRLDITLACGQSFRWREVRRGTWKSVLAGKVWTLTQDEHHISYEVYDPKLQYSDSIKPDLSVYQGILHDYFQLQVNLGELYKQWKAADKKFATVAEDFSGVRILRQDPVENLFSFICSSNNHISRISGMVEKLCSSYGELILKEGDQEYYSFPTVKALTVDGVESTLRQLGFGYRAKYISQSARYIADSCPDNWLYSLRDMSYEDAKQQLMKLMGVGAKVADCVCLMSLDKHGAIPVDTHVWQIAARDYIPKLKSAKSLTDTLYKQIGDVFREIWGPYAGWAHSVMFSADLRKFQDRKTKKTAVKQESENDVSTAQVDDLTDNAMVKIARKRTGNHASNGHADASLKKSKPHQSKSEKTSSRNVKKVKGNDVM